MHIMSCVAEHFIRYVKINTQSDETVEDRVPTTEVQWDLAHLLVEELQSLGLKDAQVNDKCFVIATLPANHQGNTPVIGFLAHMDTSPDFSGKDVKPQIIEKYDGKDILLNKEKNMLLSPKEFPELLNYVGQTLITTDGNTLLGADDKAGVAEIMAALEVLKEHPEIQHGTIKIAFTPDEETGMGIPEFDVKAFGAEFAYTLDGGGVGEMEYENFNANRSILTFHGKSVHPGDAKGVMINSMHLAQEFISLLPAAERPEHTADREGFYHLYKINGTVPETQIIYLLRDHDRNKYEARKKMMQQCMDFINHKYGAGTVTAVLEDRYFNMRDVIEKHFHIVETAQKAMLALGIEPIIKPIRGGTDGARLSYMGLPTPNLFAGGHNFHGPYEYIPVPSMEKAVQVVLKIIELYGQL